MIYSTNIEKLINSKMGDFSFRNRQESIAYIKEFYPQVSNEMLLEEANFKFNTLSEESFDINNGVTEQTDEMLADLFYNQLAMDQEERVLLELRAF